MSDASNMVKLAHHFLVVEYKSRTGVIQIVCTRFLLSYLYLKIKVQLEPSLLQVFYIPIYT